MQSFSAVFLALILINFYEKIIEILNELQMCTYLNIMETIKRFGNNKDLLLNYPFLCSFFGRSFAKVHLYLK